MSETRPYGSRFVIPSIPPDGLRDAKPSVRSLTILGELIMNMESERWKDTAEWKRLMAEAQERERSASQETGGE